MLATADGMTDGAPNRMERLRVLRQRLQETEDSVNIFTSDLIDPTQMPVVLEDLLRAQSGLRLISMSNLDVRPVIEEGEDSERSNGAPQLYRHGLVVVLEGAFLDCVDFLQSVQALPWQLYWSRLELEAQEFPVNRILVELHTLSFDEEWIGV